MNDFTSKQHYPANPDKFEFDAEVSAVFDSMALRSIPGYIEAHDWIRYTLSQESYPALSQVWDFGTSTGAALQAAMSGLSDPLIEYVGCDLSQDMLEIARQRNPAATFLHADLTKGIPAYVKPGKVAVAIFGWTLQFLSDFQLRESLIRDIYDSLCHNGKLFIFEKFALRDPKLSVASDRAYYWWRRHNGYTVPEIVAKTSALKNSMFPWSPESLEHVVYNLQDANVDWLYRQYQFGGMLITKR